MIKKILNIISGIILFFAVCLFLVAIKISDEPFTSLGKIISKVHKRIKNEISPQ